MKSHWKTADGPPNTTAKWNMVTLAAEKVLNMWVQSTNIGATSKPQIEFVTIDAACTFVSGPCGLRPRIELRSRRQVSTDKAPTRGEERHV